MKNPPFITDDTVVFGLLMLLLAFVFYTSAIKEGFWKKFYVVFPSLLMCYLLPSIFSSLNIISPEWSEVAENGEIITKKSSIYFIASRYLLPAALVLMCFLKMIARMCNPCTHCSSTKEICCFKFIKPLFFRDFSPLNS